MTTEAAAPTTATYTRADVALLGEFPIAPGFYTKANRYQLGDFFYLIIKHRRNAAQNEVLQASNLGYGPSYEEYTHMQVATLPDQHGDKPWTVVREFPSEDEEDGILAMVDHANGLVLAAIGLLEESAGAVDLDLPVLVETVDALTVDPATDPVVDEGMPDEDTEQGPEPTVEPDSNADETPSD